MTKGPRRLELDQYLDSAAEGVIKNAGADWKKKADDLGTLAEALKKAAGQAELRIGEQTLTGPALRAGMEESSASMTTKAEQIRDAGEALRQVGQQIADTRDARDSMQELGTKPAAYQPPPGVPGVEPTPEELQAQADASAARQAERTSWQSAYDKQEAKSLALTKQMDAAFLAAIPPMKEIHGQEDPTEPPPNVPSGPQGPYLPGTQAPPVTGAGNSGGNHHGTGTLFSVDTQTSTPTTTTPTTTTPTTTTPTTTTPPPITTPVHTELPSTTVLGSSQNGVTYQPSGAEVSAPSPGSGASGTSAATSAAAFGAAGGAGGLAAGAVRPGVAPTSPARGASALKPIGSTGRAGSAGSLSRPAASSPGARGAGAPAARGASSAGASSGSAGGRGSAGARGGAGAAGARGSSTSSSGARGVAGAGGAGGRGGRKGERDRVTERDGLVYDQDWLGDDDVAPGVLD